MCYFQCLTDESCEARNTESLCIYITAINFTNDETALDRQTLQLKPITIAIRLRYDYDKTTTKN